MTLFKLEDYTECWNKMERILTFITHFLIMPFVIIIVETCLEGRHPFIQN